MYRCVPSKYLAELSFFLNINFIYSVFKDTTLLGALGLF